MLKDIVKNEDLPKVKLAHFGATNGKKNFKALLEGILNPGSKQTGLHALEEHTEEDCETFTKGNKAGSESSDENMEDDDDEENEDSVKLENGFNTKIKDKVTLKLEKMFKPRIKKETKINKPKQEKKQLTDEEKKYKVNNKLQEMIKENQRLCSMIKKQDDINLIINTIRRYYSYQFLEYIRKNFYKINKGYSSNLLFASTNAEEPTSNDTVKIFEGTNEIQIYDRSNMKLVKKAIPLNKKVHGTNVFLDGCRTFYHADITALDFNEWINNGMKE